MEFVPAFASDRPLRAQHTINPDRSPLYRSRYLFNLCETRPDDPNAGLGQSYTHRTMNAICLFGGNRQLPGSAIARSIWISQEKMFLHRRHAQKRPRNLSPSQLTSRQKCNKRRRYPSARHQRNISNAFCTVIKFDDKKFGGNRADNEPRTVSRHCRGNVSVTRGAARSAYILLGASTKTSLRTNMICYRTRFVTASA
ncbi:hypothetical protein EVAR_29551_1 [Eumeta japonica]|uniref:Uncharacterized protein n=1 Tax=Eumeta variegata TaxID=151549 RepID=A0A4C1WF09_EUMVA|nr:hypothetical protein EVAR_29551_1 [Eumeta japonica]